MIFGIDIISSEALANEAVNIIDRVSDFKSYQLSNVDYKVKFCLDGEPFTVDFHTDDDGLITSCSCTCGLDKCIHKTLALLLFNYLNNEDSSDDEMTEDELLIEDRLLALSKAALVTALLDFYSDGLISENEMHDELDAIEEGEAEHIEEMLENFLSYAPFKSGKIKDKDALYLSEEVIPEAIEALGDLLDSDYERALRFFKKRLDEFYNIIGRCAENRSEDVSIRLINSAFSLLSFTKILSKSAYSLLLNSFNSSDFLRRYKLAMVSSELKIAKDEKHYKNMLRKLCNEMKK